MSTLDVTCSRCNSKLHHDCYAETLEEAALDFFMWRPEGGFPKPMKKGNDDCDGDEDKEEVPFLSESFLYPLLGKSDARSLMSRIHGLFYAMGIEPRDFEEKAWKRLAEKKRDHEAKLRARAANRERYRQEMLPTQRGIGNCCYYRSFYCFDVNVGACESGECFQRANESFVTKRMKPKLGNAILDVHGLRVQCKLCARTHQATPEQVRNWSTEKRYPTREAEEGGRRPAMKPEDWIRASVVFTALGFKREPEGKS